VPHAFVLCADFAGFSRPVTVIAGASETPAIPRCASVCTHAEVILQAFSGLQASGPTPNMLLRP
jgi:hypothetical protein